MKVYSKFHSPSKLVYVIYKFTIKRMDNFDVNHHFRTIGIERAHAWRTNPLYHAYKNGRLCKRRWCRWANRTNKIVDRSRYTPRLRAISHAYHDKIIWERVSMYPHLSPGKKSLSFVRLISFIRYELYHSIYQKERKIKKYNTKRCANYVNYAVLDTSFQLNS